MKSVWFAEKRRFWGCLGKFSAKENVLFCGKGGLFQLMQDNLEKKSFLVAKKVSVFNSCKANRQRKAFSQHTWASTSHRTQTNVQQPFSNIVCYCELAAKQSFFETSQSCVSTKAFLSHRFKSSPAIPGNLAMLGVAGYMMMAGHFRGNYVSSGDLNRPRSPEVRKPLVCFLVLFAQRKKNKTVSFAGSSEVLQTLNQHTAVTSSHRNN